MIREIMNHIFYFRKCDESSLYFFMYKYYDVRERNDRIEEKQTNIFIDFHIYNVSFY